MKFQLLEGIITESIEDIKKKYPDIDDDLFDRLVAYDPTFDRNRDKLGTYGKWILDKYRAGTLTEVDFGHIEDCLKRFDDNKNHLVEKDIYKFKTLDEVDKYLNDEDSYKDLTHRQEVRQRQKARHDVDLSEESEYVGDFDGFDVYIPLSYAASCKLGEGARWCTASTETDAYYNDYLEDYGGNYYIFINKHNPKEKYQLHVESGQFMDVNDAPASFAEVFQNHPKALQLCLDLCKDVIEDNGCNMQIEVTYREIFDMFDWKGSNDAIAFQLLCGDNETHVFRHLSDDLKLTIAERIHNSSTSYQVDKLKMDLESGSHRSDIIQYLTVAFKAMFKQALIDYIGDIIFDMSDEWESAYLDIESALKSKTFCSAGVKVLSYVLNAGMGDSFDDECYGCAKDPGQDYFLQHADVDAALKAIDEYAKEASQYADNSKDDDDEYPGIIDL